MKNAEKFSKRFFIKTCLYDRVNTYKIFEILISSLTHAIGVMLITFSDSCFDIY